MSFLSCRCSYCNVKQSDQTIYFKRRFRDLLPLNKEAAVADIAAEFVEHQSDEIHNSVFD